MEMDSKFGAGIVLIIHTLIKEINVHYRVT